MSLPKLAVSLKSFPVPVRKGLQLAHQAGATAVEIDARYGLRPADLSQTALRQFRKLLEDLNLRVVAVNFQTRRGYADEAELDARVEATKAAMQMAYRLGAGVVTNFLGRMPAADDPSRHLLSHVLTDLGLYGQQVGAILALRTGYSSGEELSNLLQSLPEQSLGIALDPGLMVNNRYDPVEAVEKLHDRIVHVYATDGVRDAAAGRGFEVPLGRGAVDFPKLLGMLEEADYRGHFSIEQTQAEDPEAAIRQAMRFIRNLYS